MKKLIVLFMSLLVVFSFASCNNQTPEAEDYLFTINGKSADVNMLNGSYWYSSFTNDTALNSEGTGLVVEATDNQGLFIGVDPADTDNASNKIELKEGTYTFSFTVDEIATGATFSSNIGICDETYTNGYLYKSTFAGKAGDKVTLSVTFDENLAISAMTLNGTSYTDLSGMGGDVTDAKVTRLEFDGVIANGGSVTISDITLTTP